MAKRVQHRATSKNVGRKNDPFLYLGHVETYCNRVAKRVQHVMPNNVALECCDRLDGAPDKQIRMVEDLKLSSGAQVSVPKIIF